MIIYFTQSIHFQFSFWNQVLSFAFPHFIGSEICEQTTCIVLYLKQLVAWFGTSSFTHIYKLGKLAVHSIKIVVNIKSENMYKIWSVPGT